MFTDEELERELRSFINPTLENQDLVKRIHMMFGGKFTEKTTLYYNHIKFSLNGNLMLFVYDTHEYFVYKSPYREEEDVNGWKLKKLIDCISEVFRVEKERKLCKKLAKIEEDFV